MRHPLSLYLIIYLNKEIERDIQGISGFLKNNGSVETKAPNICYKRHIIIITTTPPRNGPFHGYKK